MIIFDAERLKKPHTGFFYYCRSLGSELAIQATEHSEELGFYVPRGKTGYFGENIHYIQSKQVDKLLLKAPKNVKLWHCSIQRSHYMPYSAPTLLTIHDMNYLHEAPLFKHRRYLREYQKSVDRADRIVTISNFSACDIKEHLRLNGKKVDVIYNGVPTSDCDPIKPKNAPPDGPFIYCIGSIVKKRNYHTLPCLLKGNDYRLVISGRLGDDVSELIAQAKKWGVSDRVHLMGPAFDGEKKWYLQHCSALAHPTLADGFGLPPVEAMQYGKPVFLSNRTSLPEIGGDVAFYFNDDFDQEGMQKEFADGMAATDENHSKRLIARAAQFSWSTAASQYWKIYEEMI